MASSWEFIRRNRNRIAVGASILTGVYVAKKVMESEIFTELVHSLQSYADGHHMVSQPGMSIARLTEARKGFIFDTHQQSCDKVLAQIVPSVQEMIERRFDTEDIVMKLKNEGQNMTTEEKVALWEMLKLRSFARILAVVCTYPIIIVTFKSQKSILCSEICRKMELMEKEREMARSRKDSLATQAMNYVSALFWRAEVDAEPDPDILPRITLDAQVQQVFNNCIQYLTAEGILRVGGRFRLFITYQAAVKAWTNSSPWLKHCAGNFSPTCLFLSLSRRL